MRSLSSAVFVVLVAAGAAIATFMMTSGPASAQDEPPRVISVSGTGEVTARPDQASISLGVVTEGRTAREALNANTAAMQGVFNQMEELGIPEENIRTSNFSVSPIYPPYRQGDTEPRRISGYRVSNTVTVLFEDIDDVGRGLDAVVSSGANQLHGISFSIADTDELMSQARTLAVENARARAETLAEAAGVRLGRVLTINEGGGSYPQDFVITGSRVARAEMSADVPIAQGEQTISSSVNMTFEIE